MVLIILHLSKKMKDFLIVSKNANPLLRLLLLKVSQLVSGGLKLSIQNSLSCLSIYRLLIEPLACSNNNLSVFG